MRFWSLLFLETVVFGCAAGGLILGARALEPRDAVAAMPLPSSGDVPQVRSLFDLPVQKVEPAPSTVGTFLGMSDELLMQRMRTSEVKALHLNRGGSSISFRVDFADGSRAAFKPTQTNPQSVPRKEAAAYRLGRLLGLNLIAPSVMRPLPKADVLGKLVDADWARRRVENETLFDKSTETLGALMYWIPSVSDLKLDTTEGILRWTAWLTQGSEIPEGKSGLLGQLSTLLLFDLLQNNSDRFSGGNMLGSGDGRTLYYMDNAFGFQADPDGHVRCMSYLSRSQKFSRSFVKRLERLTREELASALTGEPGAPLLSDEEIDALLRRRDRALRYVRGLCTTYGEDKVLVFQ